MSLVQRSLFKLTTSVQSTEQYFNTDSILTEIKGYELALGILKRIGCKNERAFQCIATANAYQDSHVQWLLCYITNLLFLLIYATFSLNRCYCRVVNSELTGWVLIQNY